MTKIIINGNGSTYNNLEAVQAYIHKEGYTETKKGTGCKIRHDNGVNHVSCKKTKTGYSFTVWNAI